METKHSTIFLCIPLISALVANSHMHERRPFGPRMCGELCSSIMGCWSYVYVAANTSCCIGENANLSNLTTGSKLLNVTEDMKNVTCETGTRIFKTKKKLLKCEKLTPKTVDRLQETTIRILLMKIAKDDASCYSYFPHNKSLLQHSQLRFSVRAMIDISETELLIATGRPISVFTFKLDGTEKTIIKKKVLISDMARNKEDRNIFLIGFEGGTRELKVWGMENSYRHLRYLFKTKQKRCLRIAVYPKRKLLYISCGKKIHSFDFLGFSQGVVICKYQCLPLSIDIERGILYTAYRTGLMKIYLPGTQISRVDRHPSNVYNLAYNQNNIYITSRTGAMGVYILKDKKWKVFKELAFSRNAMLIRVISQ